MTSSPPHAATVHPPSMPLPEASRRDEALRSERDEEARRRSELEHELQEASKEANALRSSSSKAWRRGRRSLRAWTPWRRPWPRKPSSPMCALPTSKRRWQRHTARWMTASARSPTSATSSATALALSDEAQERASRMAVAAGERVRRLEAEVSVLRSEIGYDDGRIASLFMTAVALPRLFLSPGAIPGSVTPPSSLLTAASALREGATLARCGRRPKPHRRARERTLRCESGYRPRRLHAHPLRLRLLGL